MKPSAIQQLREDLALSRAEFARLIGVSSTTVHRWETHTAPDLALDPAHSNTLGTLSKLKKMRRPLVGHNIRLALAANKNPLYAFHVALKAVFRKRAAA